MQWGVMAVDGRMVVEPKFEKVKLFEDGSAEMTVYGEKKIRTKLS